MHEVCSIVGFSLAVFFGCAAEPSPSFEPPKREHTSIVWSTPKSAPEEEPSDEEKASESSDGVSTWEWRYEQLCKCEFVRTPLTEAQKAAREAEKNAPKAGRFIFIEN